MKLRIKARSKKSTVNVTEYPKFDGDLEKLKEFMKNVGWTRVDEYPDHVDFYGEQAGRFTKITWKQVKNFLWKSVKIERDVKHPLGKSLD